MEVDGAEIDEKELDELYLRVYCGLLSEKSNQEKTEEKEEDLNQESSADQYDLSKKTNRYFEPMNFNNIRCHKCKELGHISFDCEDHKICYLCGDRGHTRQTCTNELCFNCTRTGHTSKFCPQPRSSKRHPCHRCGKLGHLIKDCVQLYYDRVLMCAFCNGPHLETDCNHRPRYLFCYNCGSKDHIGDECKEPRMDFMVKYLDHKYKISGNNEKQENSKKRKRSAYSRNNNDEDKYQRKKKSKKQKKKQVILSFLNSKLNRLK